MSTQFFHTYMSTEAVHNRNDIRVMDFPGAVTAVTSEAESHRKLTLPGSSLRGTWTDTPEYFEVQQATEVLHCNYVWWVDLGGTLPVPVGRWEVAILLKYEASTPWKDIDWFIYVEDTDSSSAPVLHLKTGRHAVGSFESALPREWMRYSMGSIRVTKPNSQVRLHIQGLDGTCLTGFSFGGLELKPCSVDWRKEAVLLRMLNDAGDNKCDTSAILSLPKDIVARIAQYLITPLPKETLLLQTY